MTAGPAIRTGWASLLCALLLAGCTGTGLDAVQITPSIASAGGPATSTALLAALNGGLISRIAGSQLGRLDRNAALEAEYRALEYTAPGEPLIWQGRALKGSVLPSQPYRVGSQDCRQYTQTLSGTPTPASARGTACRNEDGSWSLLD